MDTERLKGHSCVHCEGIVLPGKEEEIQQDDQNPWDVPLSKMRFSNKKVNRLGITLADLEKKSTGDCDFALYLRQCIQDDIHKWHKQPNPEAVQLFVSVTPRSTGLHPHFVFYVLVHLGTPHDPLTSTMEIDLNRCYVRASGSFITCHLTADKGHNMGDFISTTERIALQPLADQTISLIREWKNGCRDGEDGDHKICSISERRFLPSRLIELTPSASEIRLRLVHSESMGMYDYDTATYSALSYCWGAGGQSEKLTADNLLSYKKNIPWQSLPKTLKDAATATHLLGMRYVWIDSLCIMQGESKVDEADKKKEISKMDKVYSHATFTIMARRGDKATDGFLHDRTPPSGTSLLPFQVNNEQHGWVTVTFLSAVEDEDNTALDTRGWITQEYVLSRRLIVFGTWYTEWSCRKERKIHRDGWRHLSHPSEEEDPFHYYAGWDKSGSPIGSAEAQSIDKSHLTDAIMFFSANPEYQHRKPEDHLVVKTWDSLVEAYTRRKLSHKEDRILAISGMAARFASTISESRGYIAGLWECRLPGALLWRRAPKFPPARPDTSQRPSWSWVSVNTPIISQSPSKCISRLRVLDIRYRLSESEAPYGAVDSAELHIEGPAFIIEWRYTRCDGELSHSGASKDIRECRWRRDEEDENSVDPKVDITLDARADEKGWKNVVLLAILGPRGAWDSIEGIVLIEVEGTCNPVRYRRLGNFNLNWAYGTGSPLPKTGHWPVGSFHII